MTVLYGKVPYGDMVVLTLGTLGTLVCAMLLSHLKVSICFKVLVPYYILFDWIHYRPTSHLIHAGE